MENEVQNGRNPADTTPVGWIVFLWFCGFCVPCGGTWIVILLSSLLYYAWKDVAPNRAKSINRNGWHDFAANESGSVIDLVARVRCGGSLPAAQEILGEYLHLTPKMVTASGCVEPNERYLKLIESGYHEAKRYNYTDRDGKLVNQVVRLEHPTAKKEFLQCTPQGWGLHNVIPPLYNLPVISAAPWAVIVEGEKDADSLIAVGIPATTVCGGAKKWRDEYTSEFDGKDVVILPDNDEPGREHAELIAGKLLKRNRVKSVRIVKTSDAPKGDVTDFFNEGHSWNDVAEKIAHSPALSAQDLGTGRLSFSVEEAKQANAMPFRNFTPETRETPGQRKRVVKTPRQINSLISDVHRRFLGFPRKVGEQMFDHDRDTGRITAIDKPATLFAWIQRKSGQNVEWAKEEGCVSREELFEGLAADAIRYEAISAVPDWPPRQDVYYSCGELPPPDPEHRRFFQLIDRFCPAGPEYRPILMALFAAPLFYISGVPRPLWVIDSIDGAGSGKTTIVDGMAALYDAPPISTSEAELKRSFVELVKRIVSNEGRRGNQAEQSDLHHHRKLGKRRQRSRKPRFLPDGRAARVLRKLAARNIRIHRRTPHGDPRRHDRHSRKTSAVRSAADDTMPGIRDDDPAGILPGFRGVFRRRQTHREKQGGNQRRGRHGKTDRGDHPVQNHRARLRPAHQSRRRPGIHPQRGSRKLVPLGKRNRRAENRPDNPQPRKHGTHAEYSQETAMLSEQREKPAQRRHVVSARI